MAQKINKMKVEAGAIIPVKNISRHPAADEKYYAIWIEDFDGGNERCLLLTDREIVKLSLVSPCDIADKMKNGRLYVINVGHGATNLVKLTNMSNQDGFVVTLRNSALIVGEERAKKNPEDVPQKGFFTDLLD